MAFFSLNFPNYATYGNLFNYLYGLWLNSFLITFSFFKLFSLVSNHKVPLWLSLLMTLCLPNVMANSFGGLLIILILFSVVLFIFTTRSYSMSYNVTFNYFIYSMALFLYIMAIVGPFIFMLIAFCFPEYSAIIKNYGGNVVVLLELAIAYFIMRKVKPALQAYMRDVVLPQPIISWILALIPISFFLVRSLYYLQAIKIGTLEYCALALGYAIVTFLILRHVTKDFAYRQLTIDQEKELINLQKYTSHIEAMYDDLRLFRHDYKNLLLSLNDAIKSKNIDQVTDIYDRIIMPTNTSIDSKRNVLSKLAPVQSLEIKSLLFSKVSSALDKGIQVNIEIEQPIKASSKIQLTDMLNIISIPFDNAIHAAKDAANPQINLAFFDDQDNNQVLIIGNSTKAKRINLQKLSKNSSKILLSGAHGLGLRKIRQILARYPFIENQRSTADHWFEQRIIIHQN